jgi:hypothetical protein
VRQPLDNLDSLNLRERAAEAKAKARLLGSEMAPDEGVRGAHTTTHRSRGAPLRFRSGITIIVAWLLVILESRPRLARGTLNHQSTLWTVERHVTG